MKSFFTFSIYIMVGYYQRQFYSILHLHQILSYNHARKLYPWWIWELKICHHLFEMQRNCNLNEPACWTLLSHFHHDIMKFLEADLKNNYLKRKSFKYVLNKIDILIIVGLISQLCLRLCMCVHGGSVLILTWF